MNLWADANFDENEPRELPLDLPRSLNDRRPAPQYQGETELYDAWQEQPQILTSPVPVPNLRFSLSLDDTQSRQAPVLHGDDDDNDDRFGRMIASQARLRGGGWQEGEEALLNNQGLSDEEKRRTLQDLLAMAASNGEADRSSRLLTGPAKSFVNVNAADMDGNTPLIYASCFGHLDVVSLLLEHGADVDKKDAALWSPLMWAVTNRHKEIAKVLLDHGANRDSRTANGRTAFDFVKPNSQMFEYLQQSGYSVSNAAVAGDFYDAGFSQDRLEEEMADNEMARRMMMESAVNLEVDLGNLVLDDQAEDSAFEEVEAEDGAEFVWDKCLHDQMFVFQEADLDRILDVVITNMTPTRSPAQKPVPANIIFLAARYAHYHASAELLETLLSKAFARINDIVEQYQWDMTMLAFWISNSTLLLHYLRKDAKLVDATYKYQLALSEVINEIFILVIRDAERRIDKNLDKAMMEFESIPGFEDVTFQNEWKIFRRNKTKPLEPPDKRFRPPSPKRKAQTSPRTITSLLASTLFVLELYDIHSVIIAQVLAQLFYWLGAEMFNRILNSRNYLARTKAMQIRMNVSTLEDWALANNRQAEHYEAGSIESSGETTVEAARKYLEPVQQLLQWLQVSSSIGDDFEALITTIKEVPRLSPQQLVHAVKYYRAEVGEGTLSKSSLKYIQSLQASLDERRAKAKAARRVNAPTVARNSFDMVSVPTSPTDPAAPPQSLSDLWPSPRPSLSPARAESAQASHAVDLEHEPDELFIDAAYTLPFSLPSSTDMLVSYGAGFGGKNRERALKYIPTVNPEVLEKLNFASSNGRSSHHATASYDDDEQWNGSTLLRA